MSEAVQCPSCGHCCPIDEVETGIPEDWDPMESESYDYYQSTPSRCPSCGADMGL